MDRFVDLRTAARRALGGILRPLTRNLTYTTRSGIAAGLRRQGGLGFLARAVTEEERFYLGLNLEGKVVYDVGAYEGMFSMFAARAIGTAGTLVIFEPNPRNLQSTRANLELNRFGCKILIEPVALGESRSRQIMAQPKGEPARTTFNEAIVERLKGSGEAYVSFEAEVEALDDLYVQHSLPAPEFIKIDTEGAELAVLSGAVKTLQAHGPELLLEMHGTTHANCMENYRAIHRLLSGCGYGVVDLRGRELTEEELAPYIVAKSHRCFPEPCLPGTPMT